MVGAPTPSIASLSIEALATEVVALDRAEQLDARAQVSLGDSFARMLPQDLVTLFTRRTATVPLRIHRLRNVLLDAWIMVLFHDRQPIAETVYLARQEECDFARTRPLELQPTEPDRHYIVGSTRDRHNYYHWMIQALPAIDWGLRCRRHDNVSLALPPLQPWQETTLALLGRAGVARLTLGVREHYRFASAEFAEFLGGGMPGVASRAAAATYARLRSAVPPAEDGADAIYVARTDATDRRVLNEAALIAMLQRQGVRVVVPGTLPVTRQIALFRRARLVIGPHGAGLGNIVGCEPGSHVYELVPGFYPNYCYNRLAQSCGLHYWGDVFPGEPGENGGTWRVDLEVVAARLDAIRARIAAGAG
jgi:capsular polysaccharide biosynthesis protein